MRTMIEASIETGVLKDFPRWLPQKMRSHPARAPHAAGHRQSGERCALQQRNWQMAISRVWSCVKAICFCFSSKTIPETRKTLFVINQLSRNWMLDNSNGTYHVSGHANRPDLQRMHEITKPQCIIPMHGEHRNLRAHQKLAGLGTCLSGLCQRYDARFVCGMRQSCEIR